MGTIVLKMTAEQISTLQKDLANYATATKNPYASFSAKVDGISVIAYTSGKVTFQELSQKSWLAVLDTKLNLSIHLMGKT